jgi:DNA polymerase-1
MPQLEADDALGIYATANPGNVICSPDKDMRQIPGQLFDMKELISVTPEEGMQWHYIQTLAGDQTDGYAGVPGIGVKRAAALFEEKGYNWKTVVEAFADKDLSEEVALENARLARILQCTDYDFINHEPILWTATDANSGANGGTVIQDETLGGPTT